MNESIFSKIIKSNWMILIIILSLIFNIISIVTIMSDEKTFTVEIDAFTQFGSRIEFEEGEKYTIFIQYLDQCFTVNEVDTISENFLL